MRRDSSASTEFFKKRRGYGLMLLEKTFAHSTGQVAQAHTSGSRVAHVTVARDERMLARGDDTSGVGLASESRQVDDESNILVGRWVVDDDPKMIFSVNLLATKKRIALLHQGPVLHRGQNAFQVVVCRGFSSNRPDVGLSYFASAQDGLEWNRFRGFARITPFGKLMGQIDEFVLRKVSILCEDFIHKCNFRFG